MVPQILSQWGCGGVKASILMGRFPRWLWRDVVMTNSPAGVKCLPLALGSGQATETAKQDWEELSKTGRKGSLFRAVRTQALPSPLQMIIFLRNQILPKKFLAMFTCVSSRGLNFCPNKASVSKSLPFGVLENEMCYVLPTNNTLGVFTHSNWCFLRILCVCVCLWVSFKTVHT